MVSVNDHKNKSFGSTLISRLFATLSWNDICNAVFFAGPMSLGIVNKQKGLNLFQMVASSYPVGLTIHFQKKSFLHSCDRIFADYDFRQWCNTTTILILHKFPLKLWISLTISVTLASELKNHQCAYLQSADNFKNF